MTKSCRFHAGVAVLMAVTAASFLAGAAPGVAPKDVREEGEFAIYASGQEIGIEKYVLVTSEEKVTSKSTLQLSVAGSGGRQKVSLETTLEMDRQYIPNKYELNSEVDGQKGEIRGSFAPNQVIFEYSGGGVSQRTGLLVGNRYTILDTNVFHQFIFLTRLFQYDKGGRAQAFDVVIPQEKDSGTLSISEVGKETIEVDGKSLKTTHLMIDTGALKIQLWVDGARIPRKIALPDKGIEVLHRN